MIHLLLPFPLADIGSAVKGLSDLLENPLGDILAFALILAGYAYILAQDDHNRAAAAKRAVGFIIIGAILVMLAPTLGPQIAGLVKH